MSGGEWPRPQTERMRMNRTVNHARLPGETLEQYRERLKVENDRYKTTVYYWLFDLKHKLNALRGWARNEAVGARVDAALKALGPLVCQDFGEDENGCLIDRDK